MNLQEIIQSLSQGQNPRKQGSGEGVVQPSSNALYGGGNSKPDLARVLELLRRNTAFRGFDLASLLSLLGDLNGGDLTNGGTVGNGNTNGDETTGGCLDGDVLVHLANGSRKPAREVKVGDELAGPEGSSQKVVFVASSIQPCVSVRTKDAEIIASSTHPWLVWQDGALAKMPICLITPGMSLFREDGALVEIETIVPIGHGQVSWWEVEPDHVYFAGGYLHHNDGLGLSGPGSTTSFGGGGGKGFGYWQTMDTSQQGSGGVGTN